MQAEDDVVRLPTGRAEHGARFDTFVEEEHVRLFKALYFVTGSREEAEDLAQEAFLKLWERWDRIETINESHRLPIRGGTQRIPDATPSRDDGDPSATRATRSA